MKRNKFFCLILAIAMSALLCGCDDNDIPDDMVSQLSAALFTNAEGIISSTRVRGEYKKFAKSCFDDIEIYGAKFTLPMNVSDLPEGFTVEEMSSPYSSYNGFNTAKADLLFEGVSAARAEIMYPANKSQSEGQIVTLLFTEYMFNADDAFCMGGEFGYMTVDRAKELLGECEENSFMIYDLGDNRTIRFGYLETEGCNAWEVLISSVGKCYY